MDILLILILLFLVAWFLWTGLRCKELACEAGQTHCTRHNVQFLDHTVERRKLLLTKDHKNNPCWFRSFNFEFATTGEHRYEGQIEMYGQHLKSIKMDPYPESNSNLLDE